MLTIKPQQDRSPIIVDDAFDLEETAALTFGGDYNEGLLAKADLGAALLSMSGYEKSAIPNFNGTFGCGPNMLLLCFCHSCLVIVTGHTQKASVTNISLRV